MHADLHRDQGVPAEAILKLAGERKPDLIVLGVKDVKNSMSVATHLSRATAQDSHRERAVSRAYGSRARHRCEPNCSKSRPGSLWEWLVETSVSEFEP